MKTVTSTQCNLSQQADLGRTNTITASLIIVLPLVLVCAIAGYRQYRATFRQRRIQRLNRIWQLDSSKKPS